MHAVGHQHHPRWLQAPAGDGPQEDLRAGPMAPDERAGAEHLGAEAGDHLREPLGRVRVPRPGLGVAVERQVGQHQAEAVAEVLDDRLELHVREQGRVQQRQRRAGAVLAVGHAGAVAVVVQAQAHGAVS